MRNAVLPWTLALLLLGVGRTGAAAESPRKQPSAKAAARAGQLLSGARSFRLDILHYGPTDKPFYNLTLSVPWLARSVEPPFHPLVLIDADEARKIIGYLGESGALDNAQEGESIAPGRAPTTAYYVLNIRAEPKSWQKVMYQESLGWGLPMLDRLEGLRKSLRGDAAGKMDLLLGRLSGSRKTWQREGSSQPATPQSAKAAGVIRSLKGWELYLWRQGSTICFSLLTGSPRARTDEEIGQSAGRGIDTVKSRLDQLSPGETIVIFGRRATGRPPQDAARTVAEYCRKIGLKAVPAAP
jgi:hypothetical protein